jgi:hypothetical protein
VPTLIAYRVSGAIDFSLHMTSPNNQHGNAALLHAVVAAKGAQRMCSTFRLEGGNSHLARPAMSGRNHISGWEFALWQ